MVLHIIPTLCMINVNTRSFVVLGFMMVVLEFGIHEVKCMLLVIPSHRVSCKCMR